MLIENNVGDEVLVKGLITEIKIKNRVTYWIQTPWADPIPVPAEMVFPFKPAEAK